MSRSNYDKPFYVDVGTSIAAIRCASNHDPVCSINHHCWIDHNGWKSSIELLKKDCDRMNKEVELYAQSKAVDTKPTCDWSVKDALDFANTLANHGWTRDANADAASSCIYALCRMLEDIGNAAAMREALLAIKDVAERDMRHHVAMSESDSTSIRAWSNLFVSLASQALAAPPRNCDRFIKLKSAQRYYIEHRSPKGLGFCVDSEIRKFPWKSQFEEWLFATTAEQEGETNGSK